MFAAVYDKLFWCKVHSILNNRVFCFTALRKEPKVCLNAQIIKQITRLPFLEWHTRNIFSFFFSHTCSINSCENAPNKQSCTVFQLRLTVRSVSLFPSWLMVVIIHGCLLLERFPHCTSSGSHGGVRKRRCKDKKVGRKWLPGISTKTARQWGPCPEDVWWAIYFAGFLLMLCCGNLTFAPCASLRKPPLSSPPPMHRVRTHGVSRVAHHWVIVLSCTALPCASLMREDWAREASRLPSSSSSAHEGKQKCKHAALESCLFAPCLILDGFDCLPPCLLLPTSVLPVSCTLTFACGPTRVLWGA